MKFMYDAQGRRIQKFVATNGVPVYTNRFLYDGWNLIAELNPASSLVRSYMWGNDLSGSQQGAGGVGGLLEVSYHGTSTTNCFPAYDGNGNVAALVNAADGTVAANFEYGPFGEPIRVTGIMADANPLRFSTKYDDDESDLLYYGYRFYKPSTGTWPNRDPIDELAFVKSYSATLDQQKRFTLLRRPPDGNEFALLHNQVPNFIDIRGLEKWCGTCDSYGAGIDIGVEAIECDLTSPCKCGHYTYVHVKAIFAMVTVRLPANSTHFRTCFDVPDGSDYTVFNGAARFEAINVTAGPIGKTGGVIVLGDAESKDVSGSSGFDWSMGFGAGHSKVSNHDIEECN